MLYVCFFFFVQAEDGIRDLVRSRGLGDVYKRQLTAVTANGQTTDFLGYSTITAVSPCFRWVVDFKSVKTRVKIPVETTHEDFRSTALS